MILDKKITILEYTKNPPKWKRFVVLGWLKFRKRKLRDLGVEKLNSIKKIFRKEETSNMKKTKDNKIMKTNKIIKNVFVGFSFALSFVVLLLNINLVNAADTTPPDVNITYSSNPAGVGANRITATYSEAILTSPRITIDQAGSSDVVNAQMETPGSYWTLGTPAEINNWDSVTYGNGLFVAVAQTGTNRVMTSPDGLTWTARTAATQSTWYSVTYGNGLFVAVGANAIMTSPDGITWTSRTVPQANTWSGVTFGNNLFVAVSPDGTNRVMTSPNGITWTLRAAANSQSWYGITYGNGLFVAVASSYGAMTSPDGITWTFYTAGYYGFRSVYYGNGMYVAVGNNSILTSPNGITWSNRTPPISGEYFSVTYGNGYFVAIGTNLVMTSPDGITWTPKSISTSGGLYSVTYNNGLFVAVTSSGQVLTSVAGYSYDYIVNKNNGSSYVDGTATVSLSSTTDLSSNVSNSPTNTTFTIDTVGPTVDLVYTAQRANAGSQVITATYSEAVTSTPKISINQPGSLDIINVSMSGSGTTWTYNYTVNTANGSSYVDGMAVVSLSPVLNSSGKVASSPTNSTFTIDTTSPTVSFSYNPNPVKAGNQTILATYSEEILDTPNININQPGSVDIVNTPMVNVGASAWTVKTPTAWSWQSVAYGSGLFVAVTNSTNSVSTSPDGITWTNRTVPEGNSWTSITYGNGMFVAVANSGTNRVMTSPDGITWTARTASEANNWTSVTYGNGLFVAVSNNGTNRVMTSQDGIYWTSRSAAEANGWLSVVYGNETFVAISSDGTNRVMTSSDGITWVARSAATASFWQSVTYGNGLFVAVGYGAVMTSPDGITWTSRTAAEANSWYSVTYGNGIFVAVSVDGTNRVMKSFDGMTWVPHISPEANSWVSVTYGNGLFVAVSNNGTNRVMISPAVSFSYTYNVNPADGSNYIDGIAVVSLSFITDIAGNTLVPPTSASATAGNRFIIDTTSPSIAVTYSSNPASTGTQTIIANYSGAITTTPTISIDQPGSTDIINAAMNPPGSVWVSRTVPQSNQWMSVAYGNNTFVAISIGGTNRIMTSPDGITWTVRNAATVDSWYYVTYGNGLFVAISQYGGIMTSPDGITWTSRTSVLGSYLYGATYGNGLFVIVGSSGIMTSPNGITWTSRTPALSTNWQAVGYGNGIFVAAASGGQVMTSTDGVNWTLREPAAYYNWNSIIYGNGLFVVPSYNNATVMTSPDGINWTLRNSTSSMKSIAYGNGFFVAVINNAVMTSPDGINWTAKSAVSSNWYGVAYGNNTFVAVSATGAVMTSRAEGYYYDYTVVKANGSTYIDGTANVTLSSTQDYSGNISNAPTGNSFVVNTSAATVALSYTRSRTNIGTQTITATYSKAVVGTPTISIDQPGTTDIIDAPMTGSGATWTYAYTVNASNGTTYIDGTATVSLSDINDVDGNTALSPTNNTFIIDTTGPTVALTYSSSPAKAGTQIITATYSEAVVGIPTISIDQPGSTDIVNTPMTGSGSVFTYDYVVHGSDNSTYIDGTATVSLSSITDIDDNLFASPTNNTFVINTSGASVLLSYSADPAKSGIVTITATYEKDIVGTPTISIDQAGTTDIASETMTGNGTVWTYDYLVNTADGSTYVDGTVFVALSSVIDIDGNASTNPLNNSFVVDTTGASVALTYSANPTNIGTQTITATYSEPVVGTPTISIDQPGSTDIVNTPMTGSGTVWTYNYTVHLSDGSEYIDGSTIVSLSAITDEAGNNNLSPSNNTFVVNTVGPTVNISYGSNPSGIGTNRITASYSQTISSVPRISINQPGTADASNILMSTPGTVWTKGTPSEVNSWLNIVYGNGMFVAIASSGTNAVMTSPDGITWTPRNIPQVSEWYGLTYGNGLFVAVGQSGTNRVMTSPDGITWTLRNASENNQWLSVVYGNGLFVAVAQSGTNRVMTSPDGITWTSRSASAALPWYDIAYGNGLFVAVAQGGSYPSTYPIMSSPDGVTWTMRSGPEVYYYTAFRSIIYANNLFVTVGNSVIYTSPDGITWTRRSVPLSGDYYSVAYAKGYYVAIGANLLAVSADGYSWVSKPSNMPIGAWYNIAYGNNMFVTINSAGQVFYAPDGYVYDYVVNKDNGIEYVDGVASVSLSSVTNLSGEVASFPINNTFTIDTGGPTVVLSYTAQKSKAGVQRITATYSEPVTSTPNISINQPGTTDISYVPMVGSNTTWTYDYTVNTNNGSTYIDGDAVVSLSAVSGTSGKNASAPINNIFTIDTIQPTVSFSYSSNPAKVGNEIITATYSEEMNGNPTISIDQPGTTDIVNTPMTNIGGSGWTARSLTASYTWSSVTYGNNMFVAVSANSNYIATSPDGITWTNRTVPDWNQWSSVTYGNGLFVAVAGYGGVMTSTDGIVWTTRSAPESNTWSSVTYGNDLFVAVSSTGTNRVMTSPDGISWTMRQTPESNTWLSVTYGNSLFVAVAGYGENRVMTSPDGITWTARTAPSKNWQSITYGNGLFVAVGSLGAVMTSTNGTIWNNSTAAESNFWYSVTYGNGLFVAVAQDGTKRIMTSPDGINWTGYTSPESNMWSSIVYGKGFFVAVAQSGSGSNRAMTAPNSSYSYTYTVNQSNDSSYIDGYAVVNLSTLNDLAGNSLVTPTAANQTSGNRFIIDTTSPSVSISYSSNPASTGTETIVANYSEAITTIPTVSIDQPGTTDITNATMIAPGSVWTTRSIPQANSWFDIAYGNGLFVAVSNNGTNRVMTSPDGITWTVRNAAAANYWNGIAYGNGLFVSVADYGQIMTSPDGITWTSRTSVLGSYLYGVTYGNGLYVIVGSSGVMTSPDGITWTSRTPAVSANWFGVNYGNGLFVAVSNSGQIMTSPNGITWTSRVSPAANLYNVVYGNGLFVAAGPNYTITSPDGINWTVRTGVVSNIYAITYGDGLFVAVGANSSMTSHDGINWTARTIPNASWYGIAYGNGSFVSVALGYANVVTSRGGGYYYDYTVVKANGGTYIDGTANVTLSSTQDYSGNISNAPTGNSFVIDTSSASVNLTYSSNPATVGTQTITATYSKAVVGTPTISIDQPGTTDIINAPMTGSGTTWTYAYTVNASNGTTYIDGTATVSLSDINDIEGNPAKLPTNNTFTIDTGSPTASITYSVSHPVKIGSSITMTATFSEPMADAPVPKISISGSNILAASNMTKVDTTHYTYVYTVGAGDGVATVSLSVGTDIISNVVVSTPTSGATFIVDNTNPTTLITPICTIDGNECTASGAASSPQESYNVKTISGTASGQPAGGSINSVEISIKDTDDNKWYNGTSFSALSETYQPTVGTTNWNYTLATGSLIVGHTYLINIRAIDEALNTGIQSLSFKFTNSPPIISNVTAVQNVSGEVLVTYDVTDSESTQTTNYLFYNTGATLSNDITNSDTSLVVSDGTNLPITGNIIIEDEIISYVSKAGNILQGLTRGALNTKAFAHTVGSDIYIKANSIAGNGSGLSDIGIGKTMTWLAQSDTQYESTSSVVKVVANDGSISSMIGFGVSPAFSLDASKPTSTVTFDAGVAGVTNSATINIPMPQDSQSAVQYLIRDDNLTQTNPLNTGWTSITEDKTIQWTFDSDVEAKTLKYQFKDAYNNVTPEQTISTHTPIPSSSFIIQDTSNVSVAIPYYDVYIGWQSTEGTGFSSYKLEQATSTDNITYSDYSSISDSSFSYISTNYYVYRNLDPDLFYKFRLSVVNTSGNTSVKTKEIIVKPDAVQNYGEGGGGSALTAPKVENVVVTQNEDKSVKVDYKLTDSSFSKKINPSYESYVFYNIGISLPSSALVDDTIKVSDASKLRSSGYIQINNEVISYTGKTGNTLTGITRGTWPTLNSSGRATRINNELFEGTPVWIMANITTPISVINNTIPTGQNNSINWSAYNELGLVGYTYNNVDIKVLVHDSQDVLSGPLSSQNDYSENGVLNTLDLTAPNISFDAISSSGLESVGTATFSVGLNRAYPVDSTVNYTVSGTAIGGGVDYTLANGTATIVAGQTSVNIVASIVNHNLVRINKTIVVTLSNSVNAILGTNTVHTYTIINHGTDSTPPVVTLLGINPIHILSGTSFVDPGATAIDDIDGDVTGSITVSGLPDINTPSASPYVVTYTAIDASGNSGSVTRNVYVDSVNTTYNITATAGVHGKITPSGSTSVTYGSNQIYNISPQRGYSITSLLVDGISVEKTLSYTFVNVTGDHTISVAFGIVPDTVAPVIALNGANPMFVTKDSTYNEPGATAFDAIDGVRSVVVSGSVVASVVGAYTITYTSTDMAGNVSVKTRIVNVTLSPTYNITATSGAHGSITPSGTTSVVSGTNQTYTITPNSGFQVATLTVDGVSLATATSYTFTNVTSSHTISATFSDIAGPIITLNGANPMSVTKDSTYNEPGATAVDALDGSRYITITGVVVTSVVGQYPIVYTATDIAGNTSTVTRIVNVTLSPTYNITATSGAHGSISPSGITPVASGTNQTYTISPDSGFDISSLVVDGISLSVSSEHTFTNVTSSHTISATFSDIAGPIITLNGANPMSVTKDSTYNEPGATAVDELDGTRTVSISGSVNTAVVGSYTITYTATDIAGNTSTVTRIVNVTLSPTYNITATSGAHGSISPSGITPVASGTNQIYDISPDSGFTVATLVVDGISLVPSNIHTFTNVTSSHTISATFSDIAGPIITLNGANPMSVTKDSTYNEPGATAVDELDGTRTVSISGSVNTAVVGSYTITYTATDIAGNTSVVTRNVNVVLATTYDIVATVDSNGSITPSGTTSVVSGTNQTYTITPNSGFQVATLTVDGVSLATATSYTFTNVTSSHTISATFSDIAGPIITLNGANPMSVTKDSTYNEPGATAVDELDGTRTVSISGSVNTAVVGSYTITYTATDIAGNTSTVTRIVNVTLSPTYNITATSGAHGSISPSGITPVASGTNQTYTISPDEGYIVATLTVDGVSLATATSYTFTNITTSHTIAITFSLIPDLVAPIITLNGANPMSVTKDSTYNEPGATAVDELDGTRTVSISGSVNTAVVGSYTITYTATDIAGNTSVVTRNVNVVLATTYDIVATVDSNGSITPSGTTSVVSGTNQTYTITPNSGFQVATLTVDGVSLATATSYTFTNVTSSHTISATFTNVADVTSPVITMLGDNPMSVVIGDTFVDPGATALDDIDGDREITVTGTVNNLATGSYILTYRASDLTGNTSFMTRTVNVVLPPAYNITSTSGENGTISPLGVTSVNSTENQIYTITPNEGYSIDSLIVDGVRLAPVTTYTFSNVITSHTIDVTFTLDPDSSSPVITMLGDNPMSVVIGDTFVDPGATALDDRDGDVTSSVKIMGTVNTLAIGSYLITYSSSDLAKNVTTVTRTVNVVYAPTYDITATANSHGTISPLGVTSVPSTTDQIYTITPDENYKVSSLVVDGVNLAADTTYTFTNVITTHTISVMFSPLDSLPPIITILGDNPMTINTGEVFVDPGATAVTALTGESLTVTSTGTINTNSPSTENVIIYSATDNDGNSSTATRIVNVNDVTSPSITEITVPVKTSTVAVITWTTNEPTTSQVYYGIATGTLDRITVLDETLSVNHVVTLSGATLDEQGLSNILTANTSYFYKVSSSDSSGNNTVSPENTFVTDVVVRTSGGGSTSVVNDNISNIIPDVTAPTISEISIKDITAFGATLNFTTDEETLAFAEYGKDENYGDSSASNKLWSKDHIVNLRGLRLGTDYHTKVTVVDKSGNLSTGNDEVFKTKFFSENTPDLVKIDNIEQFQNEIESTIESILPALVPPFIEVPKITDVTENSVTVNYRTNIKSFPVVAYVEDSSFDSNKENPYSVEISDMTIKSFDHKIVLPNLKANTQYHLQARAFSLPQVIGKSEDYVFTTAASKIQGSVIDIKKDSFNVVWITGEPTSSIVEYKNVKTGRISRIIDDNKNSSHSIKVENLIPGTAYEVSISGINGKGNTVEGGTPINVKTSTDNTPPSIANLKVESALIVGRTDKVQTIVSWQTDEPSTSTVYYEEGAGLANKTLSNKQEDVELTKNHVVILSSLKAGTVYRFTVESIDDANNTVKPPVRTIITPKKNESIIDVIFKNFDETFNFINNVK